MFQMVNRNSNHLHNFRGGGGRRWVGGVKPMVTPVHRFHQVDCVASQYSSAPQHNRRSRQSHFSLHSYNSNGEGCSEMGGSRGHAEVDSSVFLEASPPTPPPHLEALETNRDSVGKLRCGLWTPFALSFVLVAGTKFYFDHQGSGSEVLVTCTVLVILLYFLAGCTLSLCRSKGPRSGSEGQTTTPVARLEVIEVLPTNQMTNNIQVQEHPPPPYHIAITFPQRITPPPSYDKAVS